MNDIALAARQVKFENKAFWRNPPAAFFTFVFPILFFVILTLIFGNGHTGPPGHAISQATFYVGAISAFSVISACYTNIAISVSFARDSGVLKRMRGTPMPAWVYLAARVALSTLIGLLLVGILVLFGRIFYAVSIPTATMPAFIVSLIVGAATFCSLGLAVTALVSNADAAPAVVNGMLFPIIFISGIFFPLTGAPRWLKDVANFFPVRHLVTALLTAFSPFTTGSGFRWGDLAVMAAWCVVGMLLSMRFFKWEPKV